MPEYHKPPNLKYKRNTSVATNTKITTTSLCLQRCYMPMSKKNANRNGIVLKNNIMKNNEKTNKPLLRQNAEEQQKLHANKAVDTFTTEADNLKLIHELQVLQIDLKMKNEELAQSKLALRKNEEDYRQLAESSTTLVYRLLLKPELKFDYVSPSATAITGYSPEDHYNDPQLGFKLVHPDDRMLLENTTRYSKGEPLELRWIRKDGLVIWTEQRNVLLFDENNEPYAIEGNARDISDRKNKDDNK